MGTAEVTLGQLEKELRRADSALTFLSLQDYPVRGKTLVDIGSGAGGMLIAARLAGAASVLGVDTDARAKYIPSRFGIPVSGTPPSGRLLWERVICSHLIEHMLAPDEFLAQIGSLLTDDGCLYLETPAWGPKAEIKLPHCFYFRPKSIEMLAERAGLKVAAMDDGIRAVLRRAR